MKLYELQQKLADYAVKHGDGVEVIDSNGDGVEIGEGQFTNGTPALVIY